MRFSDVPQYYQANYRVHIPFSYLEATLSGYQESYGLDLDPDFQRGHVWSEDQRIAYIEYTLSGGPSARELQFNCYGWDTMLASGPVLLVDGKQRLTSARMFLDGELGGVRRTSD